ncbi:MAG: primosomal protein N' [Ruminococcaceae bacterium]|nr:primosomal protein N' [Oscillospiraceae bacterium]
MANRYARVRLLDAPRFLDAEYDYLIKEADEAAVLPGAFVTVPFGGGNRHRTGLVVALSPTTVFEAVKPIASVAAPRVSLSEEMLGLVSFLRTTTLCTTGDAVHAMIPAGALSTPIDRYRLTGAPITGAERLSTVQSFLVAHLQRVGAATAKALKVRFGAEVEHELSLLVRRGVVARESVQTEAMAQKEKHFYTLASKESAAKGKPPRLGEKQRALLGLLEGGEQTGEELRAAGFSKAQIDALLQKGLIECRTERVWRTPLGDLSRVDSAPELVLNEEQAAAFDAIDRMGRDGEAHAVLLHGVTGSGKTAVMLKTIDGVLARGKGVIVLLPEIALTPQSLAIFCSRYGGRVAVMHSALSAGERLDAYHRISSGEADVVVGTRSAVFAPVKELGLIVMDEEHEHTYKSDMNPKYHARDVARYRCARHGAVLLLCSATPSLESYKRAREGRYTLLKLVHRHGGASLPPVTVADMRGEAGAGNLTPIGETLREALTRNLAAGEQSILFLNRRGYHHVVTCASCGEAVTCPSCSVTLTYHKKPRTDEGYLVCHFCGRRQKMPEVCPSCGSVHLTRLGYGTQRVEEDLSRLFPDKRILRMDTDTTGTRDSYEEMLGAFRRHEADVLLGTQMVTKGHDFPDVTLVGVLMADSSLYLDDYRANERTFSLLTQVVGRAGRAAKGGYAVIQTNNPDHEVIKLACRQDYEAFYEREIRLRRLLVFPPFCDIALLTLSHADEKKLLPAANELATRIKDMIGGEYSDVKLIAFGPFEAPVYRAEGKYRMRMVLKCALNRRSRELLGKLLDHYARLGAEHPLLSVDLNPSNL